MDINKYLKKLGIELTVNDDIMVFVLPDKTERRVPQKELEQYLFVQLIEYLQPGLLNVE